MIVLDASAGVELLCRNGARGDWIAERLAGEFTVHVPALFDLEVLHALRGLEASEKLASTTLGGRSPTSSTCARRATTTSGCARGSGRCAGT